MSCKPSPLRGISTWLLNFQDEISLIILLSFVFVQNLQICKLMSQEKKFDQM